MIHTAVRGIEDVTYCFFKVFFLQNTYKVSPYLTCEGALLGVFGEFKTG